MWRVLLALVSHRFLLFLVALFVLNEGMPWPQKAGNGATPHFHSFSEVTRKFMDRVADSPESATLSELNRLPLRKMFLASQNPFLWACRWFCGLSHLSPTLGLLLLSNLFFYLFLWELFTLFSRMVTTDIAISATILVILWPTSYEMSLGSTFSASCFFCTLAVRHALDNQWLVGGLGMGALALIEPLAIGLLPLILYLFWYFQRHFTMSQVIKRACFFLIPTGAALLWKFHVYANVGQVFQESALFNLLSVTRGTPLGWTFSRSYAGQTAAIIFFTVGAIGSFMSNTTLIHRLIPINMLLVLLLFSPYGTMASRAPLAGVCLEGVASATSGSVSRLISLLLLGLGVFEVAAVFR